MSFVIVLACTQFCRFCSVWLRVPFSRTAMNGAGHGVRSSFPKAPIRLSASNNVRKIWQANLLTSVIPGGVRNCTESWPNLWIPCALRDPRSEELGAASTQRVCVFMAELPVCLFVCLFVYFLLSYRAHLPCSDQFGVTSLAPDTTVSLLLIRHVSPGCRLGPDYRRSR